MSGVVLDVRCSGTASLELHALGPCGPLTGFMGSKRKDAPRLCALLGIRPPSRAGQLRLGLTPGDPVSEVVMVDAGPWGDVWTTLQLQEGRAGVRARLMELDARGTLPEVWPTLLYPPSRLDPIDRTAQYLCLQARAAGCIPVWWSDERQRWESPSGARTEGAHQRGGIDLSTRMCSTGKRFAGPAYPMGQKLGHIAMKPTGRPPTARKVGPVYRSHPARGLVRIATLADRVAALERIDWGSVTVIHGDVRDVPFIPGSRLYMDPPYLGAPRYAELFPRADVLALATEASTVCDLVIVSEAEPLPLEGWHAEPLRGEGKPEWVTCSRPPGRVVAVA